MGKVNVCNGTDAKNIFDLVAHSIYLCKYCWKCLKMCVMLCAVVLKTMGDVWFVLLD